MGIKYPQSLNRYRPRFTTLTLLLVTAIVGMAIVVWQLWHDVGPLRTEVRRLRNEVGELSVDDPTKVHAIQIDTPDELTWRWRIWIPENRVYAIRVVGEEVPKEGFPQDGGTIWIREPGEIVLTYQIARDPRNDEWYGSLKTGQGASVGKDLQPWVNWPSKTSMGGGVGRMSKSFESDEQFELIRNRVSQATSSDQIEDPAAGFMIWVEPSN